MGDSVNHPPHYNAGRFEAIEVIEDWKLGFCDGNALKYIARWKHKDGIKDLKKARWSVTRLIETGERMFGSDGLLRDRGGLAGEEGEASRGGRASLPAVHPLGDSHAPGSSAELRIEPGAPMAEDDGRDHGEPRNSDPVGFRKERHADGRGDF